MAFVCEVTCSSPWTGPRAWRGLTSRCHPVLRVVHEPDASIGAPTPIARLLRIGQPVAMDSDLFEIGDNVRIVRSELTEALGQADRGGVFYGFTTPSITGVEV